ncbi:MAG: TetR/AcrR family transcriptional regulator [Deltaproteobacteria bacterium]|uniref:TetR/AcrR family transcriptional regulator n=1 Tax=Candidatus Zymogenus saltonus TaxID=2844893 RepID=A0A9D8KGV5_9DELT|nr:TetR/AcrR family transcriptional regulator [Candidatus Zymogenus saltonus]
MAQTLKEEIRENIDAAALEVFGRKGFRGTTMAEIAAEAGVSVGNIYRYYRGKEDLFYSLITPDFIEELKSLFRAKMKTADGMELAEMRDYDPMNVRDIALKDFFSRNRLKTIIVMDRNEGTRYEGFKEEMVEFIIETALQYIDTVKDKRTITLSRIKIDLLKVVYSNLYSAVVEILKLYSKSEDIDDAYETLLDYHFFGIVKLMS